MTENLNGVDSISFDQLNDSLLHKRFEVLVQRENKLTSEIVSYISEVDRRRLYLQHGCTSLFQYLTKLGYAPASAQRRIDAARMNNQIPVCEALQSGELNLTQVSIMAQAIRRKGEIEKVEPAVKSEILQAVKNQDVRNTEVIVNQMLDLAPIVHDKKHHQRDESVRVEITFTKEQWAILARVKEVISHSSPNPNLAELVAKLSLEFLKRRDPSADRKERSVKKSEKTPDGAENQTPKRTSNENAPDLKEETRAPHLTNEFAEQTPITKPKGISAKDRRLVFQRDKCCQWRHGENICGSKYQCQVDHVHPLWAGGTNDFENLQLLCGVHNRLKYQLELGSHSSSKGSQNRHTAKRPNPIP